MTGNSEIKRREHAILFKAPMVRAILEGRKTQTRRVVEPQWNGDMPPFIKCAYGIVGDRLWVREAWCNDGQGVWSIGDAESAYRCGLGTNIYRADGERGGCKWFPSIHMPRWASRITLEITDVHVERLQDISEEDALAEGVEAYDEDGVTYYGPYGNGQCDPRVAFQFLWDSIAKPGAKWEDNPFVLVVGFRRVEG